LVYLLSYDGPEGTMQIDGSTALVTGANRGLGRRFAEELLARGAKVYAGARNPDSVDLPGVTPVQLDVTDPASVAAAAAATGDVSLLINNAGSSTGATLLDGSLEDIQQEMNTHYFGTLAVTRAFAPQLATAGGGAVLNVLSVLSWITFPGVGAYSAAKAAQWALTNALRLQLAGQGTQVTALHVGYMDTDMARHVTSPKLDPAVVAKLALDGVAAGQPEVLADELSQQVQRGLAGGVAALYPALS
jgi:NAD(P)-dependent dehydrogenase (short-subunit alcohol dehydrogenase family)